MPKHIHADNMALYAQDAMETETPWERWEYRQDMIHGWDDLSGGPSWGVNIEYRRKPRTITLIVTLPEPMREAPAVGTEYWVEYPTDWGNAFNFTWANGEMDYLWLSRGIAHTTKEAAVASCKARLGVPTE